MLVIKIELWPHGQEDQAQTLGLARIFNDGTGTRTIGNYVFEMFRRNAKFPTGDSRPQTVLKRGVVRGFPRLRESCWKLLFLGMASAFDRDNTPVEIHDEETGNAPQ